MQAHPAHPFALARAFLTQMPLIWQLTKRDITSRYRGSALGMCWAFLQPMLLLAMYSFVFTVAFKARWAGGNGVGGEFVVLIFSGMIVHALCAEVINRAPTIILHNPNFVKKVVFPLEVYPFVILGSALFYFCIGFGLLLGAVAWVFGGVPVTALQAPLVLLPYTIMLCGVAWALAALGVYLRDIGQLMGLVSTLLLFLSPVFYPVSALPEAIQPWLHLNPLTPVIEQLRGVLIHNQVLHFNAWFMHFLASAGICCAGFYFFQKTRKGFADVL